MSVHGTSRQLAQCSDMSGGGVPGYATADFTPSPREHPSRQGLADRAVQTVIVLAHLVLREQQALCCRKFVRATLAAFFVNMWLSVEGAY
jgi:hypothetical protein